MRFPKHGLLGLYLSLTPLLTAATLSFIICSTPIGPRS